ncbi:MAG: hypothetical protein AMJ81_08725 [Phycisphaerae bacterium SM23_33]|nr:MAG: hypothetical protein AMJ81_08725 [Phycisphaerae bacterium SM23_33]
MNRQGKTPTAWKMARCGAALAALACCFRPAGAGAAGSKDAAADETKIQRLVGDLGADSYRLREQAQAELVKIGPPAVKALEEALKSADMEVRQRSQKALAEIRKNAAEQASRDVLKSVLWSCRVPAGLAGPLAVAGGAVVFSRADGNLEAVDARTGKRLWEFASKAEFGFLAAQGAVYAFDKDDELCRLEPKTGKLDPKFRCKVIAGTPALAEGVIYAPTVFGTFVAADAQTARTVWKCETMAVRMGSCPAPVVGEKAVYVLTSDGAVAALDRRTGKVAWSAKADGRPNIQALALDGRRVISRSHEGVQALDAESGKLLWKYSLAGGNPAPAAFVQVRGRVFVNGRQIELGPRLTDAWELTCSDGTVYLAAGERLVGLDADTGRQQWTHEPQLKEAGGNGVRRQVIQQLGGQGKAVVMIAGVVSLTPGLGLCQLTPAAIHAGVMYFGSGEGLHALDLQTRQQLWIFKTPGPVCGRPVVADGVIYFGTLMAAVLEGQKGDLAEARLYALRLKADN